MILNTTTLYWLQGEKVVWGSEVRKFEYLNKTTTLPCDFLLYLLLNVIVLQFLEATVIYI